MRLTKTIRKAFVRAAMADVPQEDYQAKIHKLIQDDAIAQLPPKVKAIAQDKDLRHFLKTESHHISGWNCSNVRVMHPEYQRSPSVNSQVEELLTALAHQVERTKALRTKLAATADAVSTRKALVDLLPEFEKYLPADEANGANSGDVGMTLRDYFAAKAMQAQIASYGHGTEWPFQADPSAASTIDQNGTDECAIAAYWFADAMMEVRQA